jgi:hypothetical protein
MPGSPAARRELRLALEKLDIPACGCGLKAQPVCRVSGSRCDSIAHAASCPVLELEDQIELDDRAIERAWEACRCECDCPRVPPPPCRHVRKRDHGLSIESWAEALAEAWPKRYREPPLPPAPAVAIDSAARVALMILRRRQGYALRHPDDVYSLERVAVVLELTRNNRPRYGGMEIEDAQ